MKKQINKLFFYSTLLLTGVPAIAGSADSLKAAINRIAKQRVDARNIKDIRKWERKSILKGQEDLAEVELITCETLRGKRLGRLQFKSTLASAKYCGSALDKAILEVRKKPLADSATTEEVIKIFLQARVDLLKEDEIKARAKKDFGFVPEGYVAKEIKKGEQTAHTNSQKQNKK